MKAFLALLVISLAALWDTSAQAHEVRPAYLEITERANGRADVLWKRPNRGDVAVAMRPRIGALLDRDPDILDANDSFVIEKWRDIDVGRQGLKDRSVQIEGLESTITDALIVIRLENGNRIQKILTPAAHEFRIDSRDGAAVPAYLALGIEHILTGIDHLLFVFGLILLSMGLFCLLKAITAFTIAHSITLVLTALDMIAFDPVLIEALVALSILLLAVELANKGMSVKTIVVEHLWTVAFGFGLLHGAAFAGVLRAIGLPAGNVPAALFMFNLGVELGQLIFIAIVLALAYVSSKIRLPVSAPKVGRVAATYTIGGFSAFWLLERVGTLLGPAA